MDYIITSLATSFIAIVMALYLTWKESRNNPLFHSQTYGEFLMFCCFATLPGVNVGIILYGVWFVIKPNLEPIHEFLSKPLFKYNED